MNRKTTLRYFRVDRREIAFLKFIIEAYEGLAMVSTEDAQKGIMKFGIAPGCETEFDALMAELRKEVLVADFPEAGSPDAPIMKK
jgi:hypothetical protein